LCVCSSRVQRDVVVASYTECEAFDLCPSCWNVSQSQIDNSSARTRQYNNVAIIGSVVKRAPWTERILKLELLKLR
jgi:hypothetical protein